MNLLTLILVLNIPLGGYLRFEGYGRIDSLKEYKKLATSLQLKVSFEKGNLEGYGAFNFVYDRIPDSVYVEPVEGYFSYEKGIFGVTLGKRIIRIGTADWLNPTDVISPKDYTTLHSDIEEFTKGVEEINFDLNFSNFYASLYFFPVFTPNKYPMAPFGWVIPSVLIVKFFPNRAIKPTNDAKYTEYGLRFQGYLSNIDFSLTYLSIYDRDFDLGYKYLRGFNTSEIDLFPKYNPIRMYGADFSTTVSGWEFHGEGAYFKTVDEDGTDPAVKNPYVYSIFGGNRSFLDEKVKFGLQVGIKHIFYFRDSTYYDSSMAKSIVYAFAKKFNYQNHENTYYGTLTIGYNSPDGNWSVDGTLVYDFTNEDYFTIPKLVYSPVDAVNVIAGLFLTGGKGSSPFSEMGKHIGKLGFLEVKFSF